MLGRTSLILAMIVLASVLAAVGLNRASAQVADNTGPVPTLRTPSQVLTGNYRVSVDIGSGEAQYDQIRRIEFHEQYVVLFGYTGSGRVVPVGKIKDMTWQPI